ncbi:iron chelate uptake ABC transporter, FeCT family, permease protein [Enterococcus faecalis 13-SD-W-01]|nr:iron chelate uptake ABC transporter, FeCT family, permease protein [Enterococcus faecalis 13-SD-W-01]
MRNKKTYLFLILTIAATAFCVLYLTFQTYGNWQFAWQIRSRRVAAFVLTALAVSGSTISFQTVTRNQFLTPSILGMDSLYILIQTLLFFVVGGITMLQQTSIAFFFGNIFLMTGFSLLLFSFLLKKEQGNLFLLLMIGMILGTLFSSISTFLQVIMDPNEYDLLQGRLFASFGNIPIQYLLPGSILIAGCWFVLFKFHRYLDVLHLGREQAVNLGVDVDRLQFLILCCVSIMTGSATALVGPITFLGFIAANVSYRLFASHRHKELFFGSFLIAVIFLIGGQFFVEHVFGWRTTVSVVVEFVGGVYFVGKLLRERKTVQ